MFWRLHILGFSMNNRMVSLLNSNNKNVNSGCQSTSACPFNKTLCGDHGQCRTIYGNAECNCDEGYVGPNCVDICQINPCLNDATCTKSSASESAFKCVCSRNFTGLLCFFFNLTKTRRCEWRFQMGIRSPVKHWRWSFAKIVNGLYMFIYFCFLSAFIWVFLYKSLIWLC